MEMSRHRDRNKKKPPFIEKLRDDDQKVCVYK